MNVDRDAAEGVIRRQTEGILHEEFPSFLPVLTGEQNSLKTPLICKIMAMKEDAEVSSQKLKEQWMLF